MLSEPRGRRAASSTQDIANTHPCAQQHPGRQPERQLHQKAQTDRRMGTGHRPLTSVSETRLTRAPAALGPLALSRLSRYTRSPALKALLKAVAGTHSTPLHPAVHEESSTQPPHTSGFGACRVTAPVTAGVTAAEWSSCLGLHQGMMTSVLCVPVLHPPPVQGSLPSSLHCTSESLDQAEGHRSQQLPHSTQPCWVGLRLRGTPEKSSERANCLSGVPWAL